jgi:protein EFR3
MDKSPRDTKAFAPYVLRILDLVLNSKDVSMIEYSIPTLETYCEHEDIPQVVAEKELLSLYEKVIKEYATLAGKSIPDAKSVDTPIAIRRKSAGLKALRSITATPAVAVDGGRQLSTIIPVLLENLYSEDDKLLTSLYHKAELEKDGSIRRRGSINTARTSEHAESVTAALQETAADADRVAAEEAAFLALQCLKQLFSTGSRSQIRLATTNVLTFLMDRSLLPRPGTAGSIASNPKSSWPSTIFEIVAEWTPAPDKFIIVVTAMERLRRTPPSEENLTRHLIIARLIQCLLSSSINMIGLSVVDILLGLMQQVLLVLQVGSGSNLLPVHQRISAIDLFLDGQNTSAPEKESSNKASESAPSTTRQELLSCLESCIASLATHIYYKDQISDILTTILKRLKPSLPSGLTPVAAVENPNAAAQSIAELANIKDNNNTDEFFSFGTARVVALNAIKQVLIIANKRGSSIGGGSIGRNKVGVEVWEGTQWLLRDEDRRVRRAYIDAILTWLQLELDKNDLKLMEENFMVKNSKQTDDSRSSTIVSRAVSSASRSSSKRHFKTTFLQLLHLAIYDNVLEAPDNNMDILLMHLLLTSLVERLGVNALKTGLPMILRLQEDINTNTACSSPKAKVNVGSLVHGYLLFVSRTFDFEATVPGYEISSESSRRKKAGLWLDQIQIPALSLERITKSTISTNVSDDVAHKESLKPFDDVSALVDQIALFYSDRLLSPPSSPPQSPGRGMSSSIPSVRSSQGLGEQLSSTFRDALQTKWSKEACIASIEKERQTKSPHGSRAGTTHSNHNGFLKASSYSSRDRSPVGGGHESLRVRTGQFRRSSAHSSSPPTPGSSNDNPAVRVEDFKKVMGGGSLADAFSTHAPKSPARGGSPLRNSNTAYHDYATDASISIHRTNTRPSVVSSGTNSVVDAEGFESVSEGDPEHPLPTPQTPIASQEITQQHLQQLNQRFTDPTRSRADSGARPASYASRARSNSSASAEDPEANAKALKGEIVSSVMRNSLISDEEVPPVPPLPEDIVSKLTSTHGQTNRTPLRDQTLAAADGPDVGGAVGSTNLMHSRPPRDRSIGRNSYGNRSSIRNSTRPSSSHNSAAAERRAQIQTLLDSIEVDPELMEAQAKMSKTPLH